MKDKRSIKYVGITFIVGLVQILLILMRVTGVVNWEWKYVMIPTFAFLIFFLLCFAVALYVLMRK